MYKKKNEIVTRRVTNEIKNVTKKKKRTFITKKIKKKVTKKEKKTSLKQKK